MIMFKKKQIVLAVIMGMVLVAGYINWAYQTSDNAEPAKTNVAVKDDETKLGEAEFVNAKVEKNAIEKAKEQRNEARAKATEALKESVNNPSATADGKKKAEENLADLAMRTEKEGVCEAALATKGINESVVIINESGVMITVRTKDELSENQVTVIKDSAVDATGVSADKIKISRIKE